MESEGAAATPEDHPQATPGEGDPEHHAEGGADKGRLSKSLHSKGHAFRKVAGKASRGATKRAKGVVSVFAGKLHRDSQGAADPASLESGASPGAQVASSALPPLEDYHDLLVGLGEPDLDWLDDGDGEEAPGPGAAPSVDLLTTDRDDAAAAEPAAHSPRSVVSNEPQHATPEAHDAATLSDHSSSCCGSSSRSLGGHDQPDGPLPPAAEEVFAVSPATRSWEAAAPPESPLARDEDVVELDAEHHKRGFQRSARKVAGKAGRAATKRGKLMAVAIADKFRRSHDGRQYQAPTDAAADGPECIGAPTADHDAELGFPGCGSDGSGSDVGGLYRPTAEERHKCRTQPAWKVFGDGRRPLEYPSIWDIPTTRVPRPEFDAPRSTSQAPTGRHPSVKGLLSGGAPGSDVRCEGFGGGQAAERPRWYCRPWGFGCLVTCATIFALTAAAKLL